MMNKSAVFSTAYAAPIHYYAAILSHKQVLLEAHENFNKQSYRTRCSILSANGPLTLSIPIIHTSQPKCHIKQVEIDYTSRWQAIHWKAIESAYRSSPYFIFYADELMQFYEKQDYALLYDYNKAMQQTLLSSLKLDVQISETQEYKAVYNDTTDYRNTIHPKVSISDSVFQTQSYFQVFSTKYGFVPNLSILDLLFNMGPESRQVLESCIQV
jgi:hypothetical protein